MLVMKYFKSEHFWVSDLINALVVAGVESTSGEIYLYLFGKIFSIYK